METYLKTIRKFLSEYIRHERTYSLILRVMVYFFQLQGDPFFPVITSSGGTLEERYKLNYLEFVDEQVQATIDYLDIVGDNMIGNQSVPNVNQNPFRQDLRSNTLNDS